MKKESIFFNLTWVNRVCCIALPLTSMIIFGSLIQNVTKYGLGVDEIYFMACHPKHGIFGADYWNNQIVHFNNKLQVQSIYQKPGRRAGQLGKVAGLSVCNDQLAVGNFDGGKVQIFDLSS